MEGGRAASREIIIVSVKPGGARVRPIEVRVRAWAYVGSKVR